MARLIALFVCLLALSQVASAQEPSWRVGPNSFGPVRIGMTQSQIEAAVGKRLKAVYVYDDDKYSCYYLHFPRTGGVGFIMMNARLAMINVVETHKFVTTAGAKVGDSEERINALYPDRVTVKPHYYIRPEGHYLTVVSKDGRHGIKFESDGKKVVAYSAGKLSALRLVEGCS